MIRILIADDSKVVALLLKTIFEQENDLQVVGMAMNGLEAVEMARTLAPDVITMDIRMPVMDGFEAIRQIMTVKPVPIVVISTSVNDDEITTSFQAIEEGALAVIEKPVGMAHPDFDKHCQNLVNMVRSMSLIPMGPGSEEIPNHSFEQIEVLNPPEITLGDYPDVVAIGSSAVGPQSLLSALKDLPPDFPVPIVVTQHMSRGFISGLVKWLETHTRLSVSLAEDHIRIVPGKVYIAPDERHLLLERENGELRIHLSDGPPVHGMRPSMSEMFKSVARACKDSSIGVLIKGLGDDGPAGLLAIKRAGGYTITQDDSLALSGATLALDAIVDVVRIGRTATHARPIVPR